MKKFLMVLSTILLIGLGVFLIIFYVGPKSYTVTFDSNGGIVVENVKVKDGEKIKKPEDPTYEGFIFDGWFNEDNE